MQIARVGEFKIELNQQSTQYRELKYVNKLVLKVELSKIKGIHRQNVLWTEGEFCTFTKARSSNSSIRFSLSLQ